MPFAITETAWRAVNEGFALNDDETLVDELPERLIEFRQSEQIKEEAVAQLRAKILDARGVIDPLQAGIDIDEVSDEDRATWKLWKRYLIALSKTQDRPGWPEAPDWPALPES